MQQRSSEWYLARLGRFTASDIIRLCGKDGLKTTSQSIETYAIEKAGEMYFGMIEDDFVSFDMQRGIELEPMAFEKYAELRAIDFVAVEQAPFIPYGEHAGASPDGLTSDGRVLEIKCPKIHKLNELACRREIDPKYYAQMQMQMLCTDRSLADNFYYCVDKGREYHLTIQVARDEQFIAMLKSRIELATEKKMEFYAKLVAEFGPKPVFIASYDASVQAMIIEP